MNSEDINNISVLGLTMRAQEVAEYYSNKYKTPVSIYSIYRWARILREKGIVVTFIRAKTGVKPKI